MKHYNHNKVKDKWYKVLISNSIWNEEADVTYWRAEISKESGGRFYLPLGQHGYKRVQFDLYAWFEREEDALMWIMKHE